MLKPETVERDKWGWWLHSVVSESREDTPVTELPEAAGMEFRFISFDSDAPDELQKRYYGEGEELAEEMFDVSTWQPTPPKGEGWFLIGIYDTEDGPAACFTRQASISNNAKTNQGAGVGYGWCGVGRP